MAEGGVEWAQAMVAAVLSSRQHGAASPAQTGRGVVEGKRQGLFPPHPQTPNSPLRELGEKPLEKSPPLSRICKGKQFYQETKRSA